MSWVQLCHLNYNVMSIVANFGERCPSFQKERDILIQLLMGNCQDPEDFGEDVMILLSFVQPLLEETNAILVSVPHYPPLHLLN